MLCQNLLGAPGCKNGLPLAEGDPGLLCTWSPKEGVDPLAQWATGPIVVLHYPVLDLLAKAQPKQHYSTNTTRYHHTKLA